MTKRTAAGDRFLAMPNLNAPSAVTDDKVALAQVAQDMHAEDAITATAEAEVAEWSWDKLEEPKPMPPKTYVPGASVDVIESTPPVIQDRAEKSLALNTAAKALTAGSNAKRPRVTYHWDVQPVPDEETGRKFKRLLVKYSQHRPATGLITYLKDGSPMGQVTARCGDPDWFRPDDNGKYIACMPGVDGAFIGVRYSVRPFEQGKDTARLPGSE